MAEQVVKDKLLLRFVVPFQVTDDLRHPVAAVASGHDERAVVHDLQLHAIMLDHFPSPRHLRHQVRVATPHRHRHPTGRLGVDDVPASGTAARR